MQNLDVAKTEAAWSSLAEKVYVPHSDEEYQRLVELLDSFIDEVGEDESHPLASLMEVIGVLIEKYEDEHVPHVAKNSAYAAERARQFLLILSGETDALNVKINGYADRVGRITKQNNPSEFEAIVSASADDLELFAQRIVAILPDYRRDLELIAEGFDHTLKCLDPSTSAGKEALEVFRQEARELTETAREVIPKVAKLREVFEGWSSSADLDLRLIYVARRLVALANDLIFAYEDLETLALKVSFSVDEK